MVGLIAASKGSKNVYVSPYLMHLIELPEKSKTNLMYNKKEEDAISDDDDYGGNDVVEINEAVDIFRAESGVMIHQVKVVSSYATMYADVCDYANEIRASIVILPFHKHQRIEIDGKLESGKEGVRITNQKGVRYASVQLPFSLIVDSQLVAHIRLVLNLCNMLLLYFLLDQMIVRHWDSVEDLECIIT
ncbi:cation H(+) antiporter 2-like [Olea europaea subsp. europaea]|uniref:Cation H(+) antiporter 2-like n=1 Tax=Olea europaea subsp. europaea TaxID=158383 RepID=A0A8S0R0Q8_OLEEU|nr:cation H(+) antiporter 2-like [Olea europaea subsp. europaea]